jgi:hypothetical protein
MKPFISGYIMFALNSKSFFVVIKGSTEDVMVLKYAKNEEKRLKRNELIHVLKSLKTEND